MGIDKRMRWRVIAWVSLGVNVALAAFWLPTTRYVFLKHSPARVDAGEPETAPGRTNLVVRRQLFSWREVESPDYPTYIANLRNIGCPEQTIRDIIIADVNALYARRLATEVVTPEQQWWRVQPDTNILQLAAEKVRALDEERRGLLARLLGPSWGGGDLVNLPRPTRTGVVLDGPVLGTLPADTKQAVESVNLQSQERLQAYLDEARREGKNPDPAELAKLHAATRTELERLLTPQQLEEFLLRYSQDAGDLRAQFAQLQYFDPTPDEFRAVFRATDALEEQIQLLTGNDPNTVAQRNALMAQRENAIKTALGPERYEEYSLLQDPVYRDAMASAVEAGTPEAADSFYAIKLAALSQEQDILGDTNLTADQKKIQLKQLELDQLKANTVAAGGDLPPEPAPTPQQPPPRKVYVLSSGDSAATIALMYGLPVSALSAANPNLDINHLRPGDSVTIPRSPLNPAFTPNAPPPIPFPPQTPTSPPP
jgi:hypothetical protein